MDFSALTQYEVVEQHLMKEYGAEGCLLRHKKTGARLFLIPTDDNNKVFNIAFRTPPSDSTGVPHIIEHTVLCGSERYPARDPFVELVKGSLNTFLNAMTYPDKTMYPVASTNDKDFSNLMSVYMDAVFHPNITKTNKIFMQEGWHYELDQAGENLIYNGVVYNEMKGAFSSADDVLNRYTQEALYPDTAYAYVSGGAPECIPSLTYEQYLAFYHRYYHPSNSYIYLYGDMDMVKVLEWMDQEYLRYYDKIDPHSELTLQTPFEKMADVTIPYSITESDEEDAGNYYSWNKVIGTVMDRELYLAFQILEYVLLNAPGAPVKKALLDKGIGEDIYGGYDEGFYQPSFNITAKDADPDDKEAFVQTIEETLGRVVKEGISKRSLLAALNSLEFKLKESDFGRWPKGLMIGLQCFDSWLFDENDPFRHLEYGKTLDYLREMIETDYYEKLVQTWLIDNTFGAVLTAEPKVGLTEEMEAETAKVLRAYQESLTEEQMADIAAEAAALKVYQETPTPQEVLEMIPMLEISDIKREVADLCNEERRIGETNVLFHNIFTSGISYLELVFKANCLKPEEMPYAALLRRLIGSVNTAKHSYQEFADEVNIYTGGMSTEFSIIQPEGRDADPLPIFAFSMKALYANLGRAAELALEAMFESDFSDDKRLKEILGEMRSRIREKLQSNGHMTAVKRGASYHSKASCLSELISGVAWYEFIDDIYRNFEDKKTALREKLTELTGKIFADGNLLVSYTADEDGYKLLEEPLHRISASLVHACPQAVKMDIVPEKKNEGFYCASQIQFVARCGSYADAGLPYTASLLVLKNILNYDYLWRNLREQGGAYGCMSGFSRNGSGYFCSYLDPHLRRTNKVYEALPEYIRNFAVSKRDMTKYIIGAVSEADVPMNPAARGNRGLMAWLVGVTKEQLQTERCQLLDTTAEDIRSLAVYMEAILNSNCICAVGNEGKLKAGADLFGSLRQL